MATETIKGFALNALYYKIYVGKIPIFRYFVR